MLLLSLFVVVDRSVLVVFVVVVVVVVVFVVVTSTSFLTFLSTVIGKSLSMNFLATTFFFT